MSLPPCVGCGWCCLSDPCEVSHRKYGHTRRCPELKWDETRKRYLCLLMDSEQEGAAARYQLHEGQGCCAPLNPWRQDVRNRDED